MKIYKIREHGGFSQSQSHPYKKVVKGDKANLMVAKILCKFCVPVNFKLLICSLTSWPYRVDIRTFSSWFFLALWVLYHGVLLFSILKLKKLNFPIYNILPNIASGIIVKNSTISVHYTTANRGVGVKSFHQRVLKL